MALGPHKTNGAGLDSLVMHYNPSGSSDRQSFFPQENFKFLASEELRQEARDINENRF